jgi:hypothetical protein
MKKNLLSTALCFLLWLALSGLPGCGLEVVELDLKKGNGSLWWKVASATALLLIASG